MTDRELLELAAMAAGVDVTYRSTSDAYYYNDVDTGREVWHPLSDDRQAFRLMVDLGIVVRSIGHISAAIGKSQHDVYNDGDKHAATRRAIVMAAAEIGRAE